MPLKVNKVRANNLYLHREERKFKSKLNYKSLKTDNAESIINNININTIDKMVFRFVDFLSPFMNNHPNCRQNVLNIGERIIKLTNKILSKI